MDKQLAKKLLPLINSEDTKELLNLIYIAESEILLKTLINANDETTMRITQGKLQQLNRLKDFREIVIGAAR